MQVTVSRVSPVELSLHVALPRERVRSALERAYADLGKEAQLRGFRKGKVPQALLRQYFGAQVTDKVFRKLVDETLPGAMRDQRIEAIAPPRIEADAQNDDAWSYTAILEVRPEIKELDLSTLTLTRTHYPVSEADVDKALEARREENATLRTPDPLRPAQTGDTVTVDMAVFLGGVERPEFSSHGRTVEIGTGRLLKEIDDALPGLSVHETREIEVTFPEHHRQRELAGKKALVKLTVQALQEKVLPELDDEFAKDLGKESLAELRASIRAELEAAAKARSENELRNAAIEALVLANPIPVPPSMIEQSLREMVQSITQGFAMNAREVPPALLESLRPEAEKRARIALIFLAAAQLYNLQVTEEDTNAILEEMARETGKAVQRLRVEHRDGRKRDELTARALEEKVFAYLLSRATITETTAVASAEPVASAATT
jgi:trigger factor